MVLRRKTTDESGTIELVETYSTENLKLKQEETGVIYGHTCTDVIAGYDSDGIPYSRFTYTETDIPDEQNAPASSEVGSVTIGGHTNAD